MVRAAALHESYLEPMARRVFGDAALPLAERDAGALAHHIVATRSETLSIRDTYRSRIGGISDPGRAHRAAEILRDAGWLLEAHDSRSGAGRKKISYDVNPDLWDALAREVVVSKWLLRAREVMASEPSAKIDKIDKMPVEASLRRNSGNFVNSVRTRRKSDCDAADWRAYFDERAAILEHDQGMSRSEAERIAYEICIVEWQNRHPPVASNPDIGCAWCGKAKTDSGIIVPIGPVEAAVWLHHACWRPWFERQKVAAKLKLNEFGHP